MKNIIDLLGKTVKFVHTENERFFEEQGQITEIVLSLSGEHQISINNNDFYILKNLLEFEILENDLVGDALEGLITDNKEFIDSLSKPLFSGMDGDLVIVPRHRG